MNTYKLSNIGSNFKEAVPEPHSIAYMKSAVSDGLETANEKARETSMPGGFSFVMDEAGNNNDKYDNDFERY